MTTYKSGKIQVTFLLEPETRERLTAYRFEHRRPSEGEVFREAMEFYFSELDHRNPRHPALIHRKPPAKPRAARLMQ